MLFFAHLRNVQVRKKSCVRKSQIHKIKICKNRKSQIRQKCHKCGRSENLTNYLILPICGTNLRTAHLWQYQKTLKYTKERNCQRIDNGRPMRQSLFPPVINPSLCKYYRASGNYVLVSSFPISNLLALNSAKEDASPQKEQMRKLEWPNILEKGWQHCSPLKKWSKRFNFVIYHLLSLCTILRKVF